MGGVPRPILIFVAAGLALAAGFGFLLGITQGDHKAGAGDAAPIAANLPANVVIKDAQPLAPPPPPPPPKAKAPDEDASDEAPDEAVAPERAPDEPPPPIAPPAAPSKPGGRLPADLPPT